MNSATQAEVAADLIATINGLVEFPIDTIVWFKLSSEKRGLVTAISIRGDRIGYGVMWDDFTERWHASHELVREKPSPV